jgi:hypothetical protein
MDEHRLKKLLDQVRACSGLAEGTPSASDTTAIARSTPTSAGSNAASVSAASVTRPKPTLPKPWSASPRTSSQTPTPIGPSGPSPEYGFVHCVHHFERMLYDNSQLARVYLHAWQVTGNEFFRTITEEILDYVVREMTDAEGGFFSTQDADSEGEEGKFFVWTPDEIREVLGSQASLLPGGGDGRGGTEDFMAAYGVTPGGNFEGKNILEFVGDLDQRPALAEARRKLFAAREQRVHPGRDEKILTSWNGLMLAAFAEAARVLSREDYRQVAERNADFLLQELRQENGRLLRTWKSHPELVEGAGEAKLNGYLEDYAYLIEGLLELYQTTFEPRWFVAAQELAETMLEHFSDSEGTLYDTSDDHETLITRPRDLQDNATPSGNTMAVTALLKLAGFTTNCVMSIMRMGHWLRCNPCWPSILWASGSGCRRWCLPFRSRARLPSSVILNPPTPRPCWTSFAMDTGPSRLWPWARPASSLLLFHSFRIEGW